MGLKRLEQMSPALTMSIKSIVWGKFSIRLQNGNEYRLTSAAVEKNSSRSYLPWRHGVGGKSCITRSFRATRKDCGFVTVAEESNKLSLSTWYSCRSRYWNLDQRGSIRSTVTVAFLECPSCLTDETGGELKQLPLKPHRLVTWNT